jgi:cellobiose phosphorylase
LADGISGDLPLLVVSVVDANDLGVVREVLLAHTYWRGHRVKLHQQLRDDLSGG